MPHTACTCHSHRCCCSHNHQHTSQQVGAGQQWLMWLGCAATCCMLHHNYTCCCSQGPLTGIRLPGLHGDKTLLNQHTPCCCCRLQLHPAAACGGGQQSDRATAYKEMCALPCQEAGKSFRQGSTHLSLTGMHAPGYLLAAPPRHSC
jgi:hypothetical protein